MAHDRFQFRLRTFFVATTILCVVSAISIRLSMFLMANLVAILGTVAFHVLDSTESKVAAFAGLLIFLFALQIAFGILFFTFR